jgi:hypothetical protein
LDQVLSPKVLQGLKPVTTYVYIIRHCNHLQCRIFYTEPTPSFLLFFLLTYPTFPSFLVPSPPTLPATDLAVGRSLADTENSQHYNHPHPSKQATSSFADPTKNSVPTTNLTTQLTLHHTSRIPDTYQQQHNCILCRIQNVQDSSPKQHNTTYTPPDSLIYTHHFNERQSVILNYHQIPHYSCHFNFPDISFLCHP